MGRWARKPVNHTSWVAVVTPTDRPKSVRNRCLIELFCDVVCVVTLPFWHFCWCRGFCHRTESDLFLFLLLVMLRLSPIIDYRSTNIFDYHDRLNFPLIDYRLVMGDRLNFIIDYRLESGIAFDAILPIIIGSHIFTELSTFYTLEGNSRASVFFPLSVCKG